MPSRRTERKTPPYPKGRIVPGVTKWGTATIIADSGMDAASRSAAAKLSGQPWGRVVSAEPGRVVLAFSIPHKDLSVNGPKGKWRAKGKATKAARSAACEVAAEAMAAAGILEPWGRATAAERWFYPDDRARDGRNSEARMKAYFDGIRDAGLIVDDDTRHLSHLPGVFEVDRENPRVELTLERQT